MATSFAKSHAQGLCGKPRTRIGLSAAHLTVGEVGGMAPLGELLLARGHSADTVAKVLGGNLLRVFGAAWQPLQARPA